MIIYEVLAKSKYDNGYGWYETYGISVLCNDHVIDSYEDVSLDRDKVIALTERLNREKLSPSHLEEVLENFLYDFKI